MPAVVRIQQGRVRACRKGTCAHVWGCGWAGACGHGDEHGEAGLQQHCVSCCTAGACVRVYERATWGSEAGERACALQQVHTHKEKFRLHRSTTSAAKTWIGRVLQVPTCKGMDGRGRSVTQLTLGHDGVDGDVLEATRGSSELGEAAVREVEEAEEEPGAELGVCVGDVVEAADEGDDGEADRLEEGGWR